MRRMTGAHPGPRRFDEPDPEMDVMALSTCPRGPHVHLANGTDPCPGRHAAAVTSSPAGRRTPGRARATGPSLGAPSPGSRPRARTSGSGRPARRGGSGRSRGGRPGRRPGEPERAGRTALRGRPSRGRRRRAGRAASRRSRPRGRVRRRASPLRRHRRHEPEQQRGPRVPHLAQRVQRRRERGRAAEHGQRGVDPDPRHPGRGEQPHRRVHRAAVHHHRCAEAGDEVAQQVLGVRGRHGPDRPPARRRRQRALEHRGQARLVELDEHPRAGPLRDLGDVGRAAPPPGCRRTRGRRRGR